jgi:hypothetical protein
VIKPDSEYLMEHKKPIEYITSCAVGFLVEVHWGDGPALGIGENPDYYQIMPHVAEHRQNMEDFWSWHLTNNQQWFDTPAEACAAFVKAWALFRKAAK